MFTNTLNSNPFKNPLEKKNCMTALSKKKKTNLIKDEISNQAMYAAKALSWVKLLCSKSSA